MNQVTNPADYEKYLTLSIPLDYSFFHIRQLEGVHVDLPLPIMLRRVPTIGATAKALTREIYLKCNPLKSIKGFDLFVNRILEVPDALTFVDISYNQLTEVDESITRCPNITTLYLHGNCIDDFENICVMRRMVNLRELSLQGNPIMYNIYYRAFICKIIPQVVELDFDKVTKKDRRKRLRAQQVKKLKLIIRSKKCINTSSST